MKRVNSQSGRRENIYLVFEWDHREDTWTHGGDVYLPGGSYQLDAPGQNRKYKFKATLKRLGVLGFDSREGTRMSIV